MTIEEFLESSKIVSQGLSNKLLNLLTSVKVISVKELCGNFEIAYEDENETHYLTISHFVGTSLHFCNFEFTGEAFPCEVMDGTDFIYDGTETYYYKEDSERLQDIAYIHNISYELYFYDDENYPDMQIKCEQITIVANTKDNRFEKYILGFERNDEGHWEFKITSQNIEKSFRSKLLANNRVITLSIDKDTIMGYVITINRNEEYGKSGHYSPYYTPTLKENSQSQITLLEDEDGFSIKGIGSGGSFGLLKKEYYEQFDDEDKDAFKAFASQAVEFLKSLFINKTFENAYTIKFDTDEKYENYLKSFENKGYKLQKVYDNADHRPATLEIFRVSNEKEELRFVVMSDWASDTELTIEYNKNNLTNNGIY